MEQFGVETGGVGDLEGLEPLWLSVHHHHQRAMPELAPCVTDADTWGSGDLIGELSRPDGRECR